MHTVEPELLAATMARFEENRKEMLKELRYAREQKQLGTHTTPQDAYEKIQAFIMGNAVLAAVEHPAFSRSKLQKRAQECIEELTH